MSDASSTDAGSLAKEFLQNGPSNSPPLQFPADPTLLEQVSQALEAIGHLQPTGALVSAVALKVVESGLANPYKPMLVMALAVETLGKLTESENGEALAELAKTASGVLEQKSADVERQSVAEVQSAASELP